MWYYKHTSLVPSPQTQSDVKYKVCWNKRSRSLFPEITETGAGNGDRPGQNSSRGDTACQLFKTLIGWIPALGVRPQNFSNRDGTWVCEREHLVTTDDIAEYLSSAAEHLVLLIFGNIWIQVAGVKWLPCIGEEIVISTSWVHFINAPAWGL